MSVRNDEAIDPDIARFVAAVLGDPAQPAPASLAERRLRAERQRERWAAGGPAMARTRDLTTDGTPAVRVRIYEPDGVDGRGGAGRPALVYVHGGGWVLFSLDTHDRLMREYAARAGMVVVGVDYSLSPEVRYPVALDEVVATVDWTQRMAGALGLDPRRIAIGGDSAGANLSLAACLRLRARGSAGVLAGMVLNYGFFGDDYDTASQRAHGGAGKLLTTTELDDYLDAYLGAGAARDDPFALPALAALHDLPPSLHVIPACDPLADGDRALAAAMAAAGNAATALDYPGATHSFLEAVSISALADRALNDTAAWLRALPATAADQAPRP